LPPPPPTKKKKEKKSEKKKERDKSVLLIHSTPLQTIASSKDYLIAKGRVNPSTYFKHFPQSLPNSFYILHSYHFMLILFKK